MDRRELENKLYEAYKMDWMINHGKTISDLIRSIDDYLADLQLEAVLSSYDLTDWESEYGFRGSEAWVSKNEFCRNELLNEEYVQSLLNYIPAEEREAVLKSYNEVLLAPKICEDIADDVALTLTGDNIQSPYYTLKSVQTEPDTTLNLVIQVSKIIDKETQQPHYSIYAVPEVDGGDDISEPEYYYLDNDDTLSLRNKLEEIYRDWTKEMFEKAYKEVASEQNNLKSYTSANDEINSLISAAEWLCDKAAYEQWVKNQTHTPDNTLYEGKIYLGNDMYNFFVGKSNILLTEYIPYAEMYTAPAEKITERIDGREISELWENNVEEQHQIEFNKSGNTFESLQKDLICKMLDEGMIETALIPAYQALKTNKTGYMYQLEAREEALKKADKLRAETCPKDIIAKDKLSADEINILAGYYQNISKHLEQKHDTVTTSGIMLVQEMLRDGLSNQRICTIGKAMAEHYGPHDIVAYLNKILKKPEIKEFKESLKNNTQSTEKKR